MPEMTAMPILPSAAPPASSPSASSSLVARSDKASNASPPANTAGPAAGAGATANTDDKSFASVLQRQLAQATPVPSPGTAVVIDANAMAFPDVAALIDANGKPLPDAATLIDANGKPLPDAATLIDANGKPLRDVAVLVDADDKALPDATALVDPNAQPMPGATPWLGIAAKEANLSVKSGDETSREKPDDCLAGQSPYLLALSTTPGIKLESTAANLTATEKRPSTTPEGGLPLALALVPSQVSDSKDSAPLAEVLQTAANKTAEFAAGMTSSVEDAPSQAKPSESTTTASSFENLLAAAQVLNSGRSAGVHSPDHGSPSLPVQTPVGARGWDGEVSDKLVWMVGRQEQRAELVLNPPQLGRVEVSLSMSGGQTTALFVSANPAVRDALEAALPRLRETLADAGVNLGQAQVSADAGSNHTANQSTNHRENWDNSRRVTNKFDLANGIDQLRPVEATRWLRQADSLVDVFA